MTSGPPKRSIAAAFIVSGMPGFMADLLEQGRPQVAGDLADPSDHVVDQRERLRVRSARARRRQAELDDGQHLPELVVELMGDEPPLFFLGRVEAFVEE